MSEHRNLEYKDYKGIVEFDDEASLFHGEVVNTRDVITFQGRSVDELRGAFRQSIDDYLDFCATRGEEPERPFSGKFTVRISPELHRAAHIAAKEQGLSLTRWVASVMATAANMPWGVIKAEKEQKPRTTRKG